MNDVLVLRDVIWFLRYAGWIALYFFYISNVTPRSVHKGVVISCFAVPLAITTILQYNATITLLTDTIVKVVCWFLICLILKKTDWRNAFYGAMTFAVIDDLAKIIAHDLVYIYCLQPYLTQWADPLRNLIYTIIYLLVCFLLVSGFREMVFRSDKRLFTPLQLSLVVLPSFVYFYARNFQFVLRRSFELTNSSTALLHVFILLLLLGISALLISVLADNSLSTKLQQEELHHMQALIQKQHQDFIAQKSATEAIQQKYHDLKNCLISLKAEGDNGSVARSQLIREIEQIMKPIETSVETGNHFLNIILAEKMQICQEHQIRLTPYADGRDLAFIDGLDLCVIVGNALDNAIEAVQKLPLYQREVHMKVSRTGQMILFSFHNYHDESPRLNGNGSFLTNKQNANDHGYGLKGISQIAEKYNGDISVEYTDSEFTLSVLIPLP